MKNILHNIFSSKGDISFKRVSSALTLLALLSLAYINTLSEHKTPDYVFDWLVMIVIAGYGGTVVESVFNKKTNKSNEGESGTTN
jgi:hypothetical protein